MSLPEQTTAPAFVVFAAVLVVVAGQRLIEAIVSANRARRTPGAVVAEGWVFPMMVAVHLGLVSAPLLEVLLLERLFDWRVAGPAIVVLLLATLLRVWVLRTLGAAWNVRVIPPGDDAIVTSGPYRWVRHPNYSVVILEVAALPLLHSAWISALVLSALNGLVLARRINVEEAMLARSERWRTAMASRPRLVPRL